MNLEQAIQLVLEEMKVQLSVIWRKIPIANLLFWQ